MRTKLLLVRLMLILATPAPLVGQTDQDFAPPVTTAQTNDALEVRMTARAVARRGFIFARNGELARALVVLSAAVEIDTTYAPAFYYRAAVHLKMRDFAGALPDLNKVVALDPNYLPALNDRGFARWQTGDLTGALTDFDRCIALGTDCGLTYSNRAALKASLGDSLGAAIDLKEAMRLDPQLATPNEQSLALRIQ